MIAQKLHILAIARARTFFGSGDPSTQSTALMASFCRHYYTKPSSPNTKKNEGRA
jgi:hypothetical protein